MVPSCSSWLRSIGASIRTTEAMHYRRYVLQRKMEEKGKRREAFHVAPVRDNPVAAMREAGFNVVHVYGLTEVYGPVTVCA